MCLMKVVLQCITIFVSVNSHSEANSSSGSPCDSPHTFRENSSAGNLLLLITLKHDKYIDVVQMKIVFVSGTNIIVLFTLTFSGFCLSEFDSICN